MTAKVTDEMVEAAWKACPVGRFDRHVVRGMIEAAFFLARTPPPQVNLPSLDWLQVAKAADAHGIRYRTNEALQAFLAEIGSAPDEDTCPACGGSGHYGDAARRAINGEIPGPKDNAAGWKIITDDAKTAGRILLLWVPTGGLGEHVELGYWSAILDKWVNTYGKAFSAAPDRWATLAPFIDSAPPQDNADDYRCPICAEPLKASDICASDITEGTCHAECLAGSPVVDLDTGDEIPGCKIDTYPYREVMEPPAAYRCDTCGAHIVAGACDCTKMQRPVLIGNDKPAPKDNVTVKTESRWQWWAGADEEWCTVGPEDSREAIIQAATNDSLGEFQDEEGRWKLGFHIVEARQDPLRMADWIEADDLLNRAEDGVADSDRVTSEYDDGPYFECTPAQNKDLRERIERACDEWQAAHGLVFPCRTFSHTRKNEHVFVDHPSPGTTTEGSDR